MLRVGLIGAGAIVQWGHARAFENRDDVRVVCVADPSEAARDAMAQRLGAEAAYADYRDVLARGDVDAVDVCLPHHVHEEAALAAFDAGKDVLIEKPIALTLAQADRMIAAAEAKGRRFYVSLNQRFVPAHRTFKRILDAGEFGRPFLGAIRVVGDEFARMNAADNWKGRWDQAGGGVLADTGTHMFYLALWWFGRPKAVSCQWARLRVEPPNKGDDNTVVTLTYDGMLLNMVMTYTALSDAWTEAKHFYFPNDSLHLTAHPEHPVLHGAGKQPHTPYPMDPPPADWRGDVAASVNHFLDCLLDKAAPEFGPEAARETLALILLAYRAAEEGRTLAVPEA